MDAYAGREGKSLEQEMGCEEQGRPASLTNDFGFITLMVKCHAIIQMMLEKICF